jgi:hypothetical protein
MAIKHLLDTSNGYKSINTLPQNTLNFTVSSAFQKKEKKMTLDNNSAVEI